MIRILILDDDKGRHAVFARRFLNHNVTHVENIDSFLKALEGEPFHYIFLDHDLNDHGTQSVYEDHYGSVHEFTGVDAAKAVAALPASRTPHTVVVHSWNVPGAQAIAATLRDTGHDYQVIIEPFNPNAT